jgi:hypothetical protein
MCDFDDRSEVTVLARDGSRFRHTHAAAVSVRGPRRREVRALAGPELGNSNPRPPCGANYERKALIDNRGPP